MIQPNENSILIDVYRSTNERKQVINKYFNPANDCFGCKLISGLTLREACKQINKDLKEMMNELK